MKKSPLPVQTIRGSDKQVCGKEGLVKLLRWHFGYADFRGTQLDAIQAVLSGRDCFCLMPTGAGKSMCYQIPALAKPGIVLVVSPLIGHSFNAILFFFLNTFFFLSQKQIYCRFDFSLLNFFKKNLQFSSFFIL